MAPSPIVLKAHPPERRRRAAVVAPCCCCCCCCCCLHSVGGLVGALVPTVVRDRTGNLPAPSTEDAYYSIEARADEQTSERTAARLYWIAVVFVVGLGLLYYVGQALLAGQKADDLFVFGIITLLVLPAAQLAASLVSVLAIGLSPASLIPHKGPALARIGKITAGTVLGTLVGIGVMVAVGIILMAAR